MSEPNKNILDGSTDFCGLTLRPITIGTMEVCRMVGLTMFTGEAGEEQPPAEQIRQTAGYLWIQSQPLADVLASVLEGLTPAAWFEKNVLPFMFEIEPKNLEAAAALIMAGIERVGGASVGVQTKPGANGDDEPPNS
jgi:hypothetical protein